MAETITFDGIKYQIPVDMHEFEQKAIELDRIELIGYALAKWGMEPRLTNIAWIALQIGEFDFTGEDVLIYLIEELENLRETRVNAHVVLHSYDPEPVPMTSRVSYMPDDEWRMIYDDKN